MVFSVAILAQAILFSSFANLRHYDGFVRMPHGLRFLKGLWVLLLCILSASSATGVELTMPHVHSIAKKMDRTHRALQRGFAPSVAGDKCAITCQRNVQAAAVACVRSLELHFQHDAALPLHVPAHHHARLAARDALTHGIISSEAAAAAASVHRKAGRKKHLVGASAKG